MYEVDYETKRIRRISGKHEATPNQGQDGRWRSYQFAVIELGRSALVKWAYGDSRGTMTSRVTEIE